ncbi:hypothetical protein JL720_6157 [Aureococcus anophagefferens]|nr:hypothetical protein JL720_6157 [Aureococcus anophagefferens]
MDVKEKFLELLGAAQGDAGVSNETLQRKFPGESYAALLPVINELLAENRLELLKEEGKQDLTYRLRDKAQAEKLSELTNEQLLVLQVVERAENAGVWLRDIKNATSMQQQTLNKALKVLESRKLVKTVKSVQQKTKKLYMAYDLVPTREVSGGPWYTDQEFDHEFVGAIKKIVVKCAQSVQASTLDRSTALERSGIATVPLSVADVKLVIDTLLCDSKLEEFTAVTAASKASRYKIAKPAVDVAWVGEVPAGCVPEAPGRRYCADGRHAPASCHLAAEQDDDDELECTGVRRS